MTVNLKQFIEKDTTKLVNPRWDFTMKFQYGKLLKTNPFLKTMPGKLDFMGSSIQLTKQTNGSQGWEGNFGFPYYGGGIAYFDLLEQNHMNNPYAVYGVFGGVIKRNDKWKWNYELNLGLAYKWRTFSQKEDYYNITFGSKTSVYVALQTQLQYQLNKYFDIGIGGSFNHFSNGGFKKPNKGLNQISGFGLITYTPERSNYIKETSPKEIRRNSLDIYGFYGYKNVMYCGVFDDLDRRYNGFFFTMSMVWKGCICINLVNNHLLVWEEVLLWMESIIICYLWKEMN